MNAEIKAKWVLELKSGKYKRGNGLLKVGTGEEVKHCCLGVLCELYKEETGEGEWVNMVINNETKDGNWEFKIRSTDASNTVLPRAVEVWSNIKGQAGAFHISEDYMSELLVLFPHISRKIGELTFLTEINDASTKEDFSDVIPFIEKYF